MPEQQLWDPILALAKRDNSKVPQLLDYVEVYSKPHRIVRLHNKDATLEEMRLPLINMFKRLEVLKNLLSSALLDADREKQKAHFSLLGNQLRGFKNIHNKCDACHRDLLPRQRQDYYRQREQE